MRIVIGEGSCGIAAGAEKLSKGLGLRGIEERLEEINGRVEYYNDNGFVVNMVINKGRQNEH